MTSLIRFEIYKMFSGFKWVILIAIILLKAVVTYAALNVSADFSIPIYEDYISQLSQMESWEAELFVPKEAERLNGILSEYEQKQSDYAAGTLSLEDYKSYMKQYYDADSKKGAFEKIQLRYEQFFELDRDERVWFYDLEWRAFGKMLTIDFYLLFALFIFCVPVFCREHSSGVHTLNMVSKNGRTKLHIAKLIVILLSTLTFAVLIYSVDIAVMGIKYGFANYDKPYRAIIDHGVYYDDMPILRFFVLMTVSKILWAVCAALIIGVVSVIAKNAVISVIISASLILIPIVTVPDGNKLERFCTGIGLKGNEYHVNLLIPAANIVIRLALSIAVMMFLYPPRIYKKPPPKRFGS